jgi:hypothetical protein
VSTDNNKFKVINNFHGGLGFYKNASPQSYFLLKKQDLFTYLDEEEIDYISLNQTIIQRGMLWIDDKDMRIKYGIEKEDGNKVNFNVLKNDEIKNLIEGNYKKLEKVLNEISEQNTILQFVDIARELKIDSKTKIDLIEAKSKIKLFEEKI